MLNARVAGMGSEAVVLLTRLPTTRDHAKYGGVCGGGHGAGSGTCGGARGGSGGGAGTLASRAANQRQRLLDEHAELRAEQDTMAHAENMENVTMFEPWHQPFNNGDD